MALPDIEMLISQGWNFDGAVEKRAALIRAADPQEQYWAYSADLAKLSEWEDQVRHRWGVAAQEMSQSDTPYESVQDSADAFRETLRMIARAKIALMLLKEGIVKEHGEMKVFDPVLIDAAFRSDIPPLWPREEKHFGA